MIHLPQLISDLALILIAAAFTTLLFKKIKQPLVLGYIIAGLLVGPHFKFLPTVADEKNISIWAEIGVIFLLFSLGLEFSFKKLAKVGGAASITGITEAVLMFGIGYGCGVLMNWTSMDSIFLGGVLSISSTTIIIRAFEELKVKHKKFASLVFGVLIVEDLVAILIMVLLTTVSVSSQFSGGEMLFSILKFAFFLVLWFLGGIFLVPSFLKKAKNLINEETLLIISIGLCLLMVVIAVAAGFSPALGAFIMGSILAETTAAEKIEHLTESVKTLFGAVFFVSVGMMINPQIIIDYALPIFIITIVTIVGKFLSTTLGALISGQPFKVSIQSGLSVAQIGEFSFIIASLGLTLNATSSHLYPIAVAVSAITTFTTPYLIKSSDGIANFLEKHLPQKWIKAIESYSKSTAGISTNKDWQVLFKAYLTNIIINGVILISILFLSNRFIQPFILNQLGSTITSSTIGIISTFIIMSPFIWGLSLKRVERTAYSHLWLNSKYGRSPLITLEIARISLGVGFIYVMLNTFIEAQISILVVLIVTTIVFFIFTRKLQQFYNKIESRFVGNLNDREKNEGAKNELAPWDSHLTELTIRPESTLIGKTLKDLGIRESFGVNIAQIHRGRIEIVNPGPASMLMPHDKLLLIGTDDQLEKFNAYFDNSILDTTAMSDTTEEVTLVKVRISSDSILANTTIRNSRIREKHQGLIVGIERNENRILNPESDFQILAGDLLWIVGRAKKIDLIQKR